MTSPRKANASGMIQPAERPHARRAATSAGNDPARPHISTSTVDIAAAAVTQAYFPKRSPTGPMMSCTEPCASAYAVTTIDAAPTLTPKSAEICGNSESETRTIDWLAKEARASSVIALVALPRGTGGVEDKVDSDGPGA